MASREYQERQARAHARPRNPRGTAYVDWLIHIVDTHSRVRVRYPDLPEGFDARFKPDRGAIEKAYRSLVVEDLPFD